jgi:hypothetical protein
MVRDIHRSAVKMKIGQVADMQGFISFDRAVNDFDFKLFTKQPVMRNRVDSRGIEPIPARTSDKLWGMVSAGRRCQEYST